MARLRQNFFVFLIALVICTLATWALGLADIKYKQEHNLAFVNGFPGDTELWQRAGDWSNVTIDDEQVTVFRETENRSYAKRHIDLSAYPSLTDYRLRVRGEVHTNKKVENPEDTRGASYMVWLEDIAGENIQYYTVQGLTGDQDSYQSERILNIDETVSAITLVLNSRDSLSSFSLTNASAELLSVTLLYRIAALALIIAWMAIAVLTALWLRQYASRKTFVLVGVLLAAIIIGVMLPETFNIPFIDPLYQQIQHLLPVSDIGSGGLVYKLGHFLFFFLTSVLLMKQARSLPISRVEIAGIMFLLAVATEGMQLHLPNRSTQVFDIGVDSLGILLAWFLAILLGRKRSGRSRRSRSRRSRTTN